jgi:hypothetical protein
MPGIKTGIDSFSGDFRNIATLARTYNGYPFDYVLDE